MKLAGITKWTDEGKIDFHALRTSYTGLVFGIGGLPKETMVMMRHSSERTTMQRYAKAERRGLQPIADAVGMRVTNTIRNAKESG